MPPDLKFKRGARPSSRHALLAAVPYQRKATYPAQFAIVPSQLSYWGNQQDGDCVTAEEAYAKAAWSIASGLPELFVPEQEAVRWAAKNGYLNGASLTEVMDSMAQSGFQVGTQTYSDGPYTGVDYSDESTLQSAISDGPVKIAIDADALPSSAGNGNGWWTLATQVYQNTDHCVGLSGYGTAAYLFAALGLPVPAGLDPTQAGYLLFTWSSLGFVTHGWLMGTCSEAWLRQPTTPGQSPVPAPAPVPPNPPAPVPPAPATTLTGTFVGTFTPGSGSPTPCTCPDSDQVNSDGPGPHPWPHPPQPYPYYPPQPSYPPNPLCPWLPYFQQCPPTPYPPMPVHGIAPAPTQASAAANLVGLGLGAADASAVSAAMFTFQGTGDWLGALSAVLFHARRLSATGSINPANLAAILAFLLQLLPLILPLIVGG